MGNVIRNDEAMTRASGSHLNGQGKIHGEGYSYGGKEGIWQIQGLSQ